MLVEVQGQFNNHTLFKFIQSYNFSDQYGNYEDQIITTKSNYKRMVESNNKFIQFKKF